MLKANCKNNAISRFRSIKSTKLSATEALLVEIISLSEDSEEIVHPLHHPPILQGINTLTVYWLKG
jgi:hypothetical protein